MKVFRYLISLFLLFLLPGCPSGPDQTHSGEIILSSELFGTLTWYVQGYRFETEEYVNYPGTSDVPDLLLENLRRPNGDIVATGFSSPGNLHAFLLKGTYASPSEAGSAYDALLAADTLSSYSDISDTLRVNQLWLFRSSEGRYAKILVEDITPAIGLSGTPHYEVLIRYRYQPDDSPALGE
ncbi:MAG: hypothetical protein ACOYXB_12815 [Bacteroidota bacterium]